MRRCTSPESGSSGTPARAAFGLPMCQNSPPRPDAWSTRAGDLDGRSASDSPSDRMRSKLKVTNEQDPLTEGPHPRTGDPRHGAHRSQEIASQSCSPRVRSSVPRKIICHGTPRSGSLGCGSAVPGALVAHHPVGDAGFSGRAGAGVLAGDGEGGGAAGEGELPVDEADWQSAWATVKRRMIVAFDVLREEIQQFHEEAE
jgi:hypothetical protein